MWTRFSPWFFFRYQLPFEIVVFHYFQFISPSVDQDTEYVKLCIWSFYISGSVLLLFPMN